MPAVAVERHGLQEQEVERVTYRDLQATAVRILQGTEKHDRLGCCGRIRVPTRDVIAYGDSVEAARYTAGIGRCGDVWACARCSRERQWETRQQMEAAIEEAMDRGWWIYMANPTIPHSADLELEETADVLQDAWGYMLRTSGWAEWKERLGIKGYAKAFEVTHGDAHGFHPHFHIPIFFETCPEEGVLEELREWMLEKLARRIRSWYRDADGELQRWPMNRHVPEHWTDDQGRRAFTSAFRPLHPEAGLTLTGGQNAGAYIAKMGLGRELSDFGKVGRHGNRTMFQVLLHYHLYEDPEDARIFREYVKATMGRSRWHWTPGLKADLLGEEDQEDEEGLTPEERWELEAEKMADSEEVVCYKISGDLWDELRWEVSHQSLDDLLREVYNSGGLSYLRDFIQAQFRWSERRIRVRLDADRRFLWMRRDP